VVMATHDLDFAAAAGARLMLIADGRMTQPEPTGPGP
jgi:ABC-type cobalamin/Fe3+-siderophores transport system ATPase subunit